MFANQALYRAYPKFATLLIAFAACRLATANEVLHYLPEDALGFAVVRDLNSFNTKAEQLTKLFELPVPAPLAFVQFATGISEGLDLDGDLLVAMLPGTSHAPTPQPMVLLPIADYERFAASVNGDESGETCRVTIAGEDVLVAKQGPYALLMNVEHRETLELMIGLEPEPVAVLKPLEQWIADNDVTITLMPAGFKMLLALGQQSLGSQQQIFAEQRNGPEAEQLAKQMQQKFAVSKWMLEMLDAELKVGAVGLAIDEQRNLRLGKRILIKDTGILGKTKQIEASSQSPLAGYPDQPYVVVAGGPFPKSWGNALATASRKMMEIMPEANGLEGLGKEKWQELEETYRTMMRGLEFSSMILLPGKEGDPLFSNLYGIAKVADAAGYLDSYQKAMETWNQIMAQSTSDIQLQYEVTPTTVGDAKACEIVVDVAAAAQAPNVPVFNWMLEAMFGEDGKLRQLLVAANEKTIVYGMAEQDQLKEVIDNALKGEVSLSSTAEMQATMKLMPDNAPWKMVVSPAGCVQWATRFANEFLVHLQGNTIEIPQFPPCPPVGFSMNLADSRLELDMVWSAETLKALAAYTKTCQDL